MSYIASQFNDTIGVYSEGLGGYIAFYRRIMMPFLGPLASIAPRLKVPVSSYLSWKDIIDPTEDIEWRLCSTAI